MKEPQPAAHRMQIARVTIGHCSNCVDYLLIAVSALVSYACEV